MKKLYSKILVVGLALIPSLVFAQQGFVNLSNIVTSIAGIVQKLIPLAFGLAILGFFWGLAKYIFSAGNEESKIEGKKVMLYGLIAIFVMASVFGIVKLAQNTLGVTDNSAIQPPQIRVQQ